MMMEKIKLLFFYQSKRKFEMQEYKLEKHVFTFMCVARLSRLHL